MAISFVGSAEASAINGGDPSLDLSGLGLQQNDLVIVAYEETTDFANVNMAMVTADYTEVADLFSSDTYKSNLGVFYKFMGATPDSTAVCNGSGDVNHAVAAVCMVFRGVDTTTPMDVAAATATGLSTFHPNPPSIDHNNPTGVWTVIAGGSGHGAGGTGTYTFPTGYTTNAIDRGENDDGDATVGMGYNTSPADPENPDVMTHSGTDSAFYAWCAVTMALRPAVAAAAEVPGWFGARAQPPYIRELKRPAEESRSMPFALLDARIPGRPEDVPLRIALPGPLDAPYLNLTKHIAVVEAEIPGWFGARAAPEPIAKVLRLAEAGGQRPLVILDERIPGRASDPDVVYRPSIRLPSDGANVAATLLGVLPPGKYSDSPLIIVRRIIYYDEHGNHSVLTLATFIAIGSGHRHRTMQLAQRVLLEPEARQLLGITRDVSLPPARELLTFGPREIGLDDDE